jgi:Flp pilus assembly protein protease CpaA
MGLGDVKLTAFTGTFIGPDGVLIALLAACVVGALVGLVSTLRTGDPLIPFGPFLAAGVLLARFGHAAAMSFLLEDWPRWLRESSWGLPATFAASLGCLAVLVYLRRRRRAIRAAGEDAPPPSDS